jgi:DNA polymerase III subunit alpha, Gram-positive type
MLLNVLDLEFTQPSEAIIQVGAVQMDMKTGKVRSKFNDFVNPREQLTQYIIDLTGITQEQVDAAPDIKPVLEDFWLWLGSKHVAAWGNDVQTLLTLSERIGLAVPGHLHLYDVKAVASVLRCAFPSSRSRGGLKDTMDLFGVPFKGRQHNALDDAEATAELAYHFVKITRGLYSIKGMLNEFD